MRCVQLFVAEEAKLATWLALFVAEEAKLATWLGCVPPSPLQSDVRPALVFLLLGYHTDDARLVIQLRAKLTQSPKRGALAGAHRQGARGRVALAA